MRRAVDVLKEEFDTGNARYAGARLRFFEGPRSSTYGQFPAGKVLASPVCPAPLFKPCTSSVSGNTVTLSASKVTAALQDTSADADGTLGCYAYDDNGVFLGDGTVGLAGSGADCIVDRLDVVTGGAFVVQSLTETRTRN